MDISVRVSGIGQAGPNVSFVLEIIAVDPAASTEGEAIIDLSWTAAQIEAEIADTAKTALRDASIEVPEETPVTIIGGVSKV